MAFGVSEYGVNMVPGQSTTESSGVGTGDSFGKFSASM